jgi:predicted nucleic acid-binding protein
MATIYLLDSGPLGLLAHDRASRRIPIQDWLTNEMAGGASIYISEVADYEVRRELARLVRASQLPPSRLDRLDQLASLFGYLPVSTAMWKRAAELWAEARLQGHPSASDPALDGDVLIAAQALKIWATVVTTNATHLGRWVAVQTWPP